MNENIEFIKNVFLSYYANQKYFVLFLIALLFIFIKEKQKTNQTFLIYYSMVILIILLNPIFVWLIFKMIPQSVYYRFLWTIPFGIIQAYFGVRLMDNINTHLKKNIIAISFILIIIYSGAFVYNNLTFEKVNNWHKLPEEYIQVTQIVKDIPLDNKKAMVSTDLVGYIRQFDASIKLAYPRRPYADYQMYPIVKYYNAGDVKNLVSQCQQNDINIIVYDNSIPLTISPSHYGYDLYAQTEHYDIYALSKEIKVDEETISIEGLQSDYKLCFVNDLHIIVPDEDVSNENKETVQERQDNFFKTIAGERSFELWKRMPAKINELNPDCVILGGDMIDYASKANIESLKNGIDQINVETMYLRADHDYGRSYNPNLTTDYITQLEKSIDENLEVYCKDLGEILIVGIDNSTSQISDEALAKLKEIFTNGKPIILATHVPLNSKVDNNLAEESKKVWQDRNLTWDETGTTYTADENTKKFLNLLYAENSPVKAVLAGHLHFKHTGKINENITQYVFDASYQGKIGVLHIVGK